ncbi:p24 complex component [Vanrija albida]|uniref:P24 complex component n=1 Tax=Vanrija albida TaxID=181172 RepID=A0ABR3PSP5_9TREE
MRTVAYLAFALALLASALAHRIDVTAGAKKCFHEEMEIGDKMTITYEVGASTGGKLDIDLVVSDPIGDALYNSYAEPQGTVSITATKRGLYTYCFNNQHSSWARKTLSFNVHGVRYIDDNQELGAVEEEIRDLAQALMVVKDEQSYLVVRERTHRDTCESTNSRVKWWGITQIGILLAVCAWNVHYLKSWFEVKRVL